MVGLPWELKWPNLIGVHLTGKLSGYLSRSAGLQFAAVLNYLAAMIFAEFTGNLPG